jgi:hypothetical protein
VLVRSGGAVPRAALTLLRCLVAVSGGGAAFAQGDPTADDARAVEDEGASDGRPFACESIRQQLHDELASATRAPILLAEAPVDSDDEAAASAEPCESFVRVRRALTGRLPREMERGILGTATAVAFNDGPHGSGRYWTVTLAVRREGMTRGACLATKTGGWRNLPRPRGTRLFGAWYMLVGGRLVIWTELAVGASEAESLIYPVIYRLGRDTLVLDEPRTLAEIGRFGRTYARIAKLREDEDRDLHRVAAAAYRAVSNGTNCSPR